MIIVWGSIEASHEHFEAVKTMSVEHVHRSRDEPGCISHGVHVDVENPHRLVFIEEWESREALQRHFEVPESTAFVRSVGAKCVAPPKMRIFEAAPVN